MTKCLRDANYKRILVIILVLIIEVVSIVIIHSVIIKMLQRQSEIIYDNSKTWHMITDDMKYFPVPLRYKNEISYEDSFGAYRENGGHEGCDIMDMENVPGRIPIISSTDGVITNIGWLYLGGYRMGITSDNGIYYYYAHLASYASGLKAGDSVIAGQLIGFMGNTGEGKEGTSGKFPVHLHFGIYSGMSDGNEMAINPYQYLKVVD